MGRPFNFLCISVILGIVVGYILNIFITGYILVSLLLLLLCIGSFPRYSLISICISFFLLGNFTFYYHTKDTTVLNSYQGETLVLQGEVQRSAIKRVGYHEYDIKVFHLITPKGLITIDEQIKLQVKSSNELHPPLEPGHKIILNNVVLIEDFYTEALTGYQMYLRGKGIKSVLRVEAKDLTIDGVKGWNLLNTSYKTKEYIEKFFDESLQSVESNLLKSIMFGNQGYLDQDSLLLFSISGTAHIIAVSGLHVGVLVLILHGVLRKLNMAKKKILLITMMTLFLYGYIVDFPVSIVRANCMYYLYIGGYFFERRYDAINSLMMMAFTLLLYNPFNLFSISFQLSFTATLSILMFYPILKDYFKVLPKSLQSLVGVTLSAQLGTIPVMIYHFQQISIIAPLANIFIVPTLVPLLSMGFFSVLFSIVSRKLGYIINFITNGLLVYIYWVIEGLSRWKFASIEIKDINNFYIFIYYLILFIVYFILWKKKQNRFILEKE